VRFIMQSITQSMEALFQELLALRRTVGLTPWQSVFYHIYQNIIQNNRWQNYLRGLGVTLQVSFFACLFGLALGFVLALMRLSKPRPGLFGVSNLLRGVAGAYIQIIRGTPMLLQILIINFGVMAAVRSKVLIGVVACGLNSAAYISEILRGGILAVDSGQVEAGRSLGLTYAQTLRLIVIPQALKAALPALCNEFITLIKETSILAYIALTELTTAAQQIRSNTFSPFMPYIAAGVLYLIVVIALTQLVGMLERRLRQGDTR